MVYLYVHTFYLLYYIKMKKSDILNIIITFIVGSFTGAYLYIYGFAPQFSLKQLISSQPNFQISAEVYGLCDREGICGSFQLGSDGTYLAFSSVARSEERTRREGEIPSELLKRIKKTFTVSTLDGLDTPLPNKVCPARADTAEYYFTFVTKESQFKLDTCSTALSSKREEKALLLELVDSIGM